MAIETGKREVAKAALREALAVAGGDTKQEVAIAAIKNLCVLNPTIAPARCDSLLVGDWRLISAPNFPQGQRQADGKFVFTLGRLAFNMFQPAELKVVIERVLQPVFPIGTGEQHSHDIIVEFQTVDQRFPQLAGVVRNLGVCQPVSDTLLQVKFTGGVLAPQDSQHMGTWQAIFGEQRQLSRRSWREKLMFNTFKVMLGLVPPSGMNPNTGEVSFTMKRSPKGKLEILYLDEELRITRGERGTVLICER